MSHLSTFAVPPELILHILARATPTGVSSFSQTCRSYRNIVYGTDDQQLWRDLYLAQPLDDLRKCITTLARPLAAFELDFDWRTELQRFVRAENCVKAHDDCSDERLADVLHALIHLATRFAPSEQGASQNHIWLKANLHDGRFVAFARTRPAVQVSALRLHALLGPTLDDYTPRARAHSRALVYDLAQYGEHTCWGPFRDGTGRTTDWAILQPIHHLMCMNMSESTELAGERMPDVLALQGPSSGARPKPEFEGDWIGIAGLWHVSFAFCEHRQFVTYNRFNFVPGVDQDASFFEHQGVSEVFRTLTFELRVVAVEENPELSSAPIIQWEGEMAHGIAKTRGTAMLMDDGNVHWSFCSGQGDDLIWSSEGVQIGSVHGPAGIFGTWTTSEHDDHDPVGPFWLRRAQKDVHHVF